MKECRNFHLKKSLSVLVCGLIVFLSACGVSKDKHLARGEEYLQKRKFHEAVMEFRAAAEIDRYSAEAHWGLARAFENLGDFYETIENLRKAAELAPERLEIKTKLGSYYLLFDPPLIAETEKLLDEIFAQDAGFIEGHILKANLFAVQGKPEAEVLPVFNHAISLDSRRAESYLNLSRYFMRIGKTGEAERAIQEAIEKGENKAAGYLEYGKFLTYTEKPSEAEAQFLKAIEAAPENIEAREAIAGFYLGQKQPEKAEQAYKDLVQIQENSPESRIALADFYAGIGRGDDAVRVFNEILNDSPETARARYRLAEIYLERKELEKVKNEIEQLLAVNDADMEALMLRARLHLQENKAEAAIKDLQEVLKKQPTQKNALFYMAQARLAAGRIDEARAFIGDLERYHPNFLQTDLLKIQASFAAGQPETALRQANELLEIVKRSYPAAGTTERDLGELGFRALTSRGLANLELGNFSEAKRDLQEVARLSPDSAVAMVNLAKAYVAEKNLTDALNLYEKALNADSENFDALSGLIFVLTRQGNFEQARARIDQAIQKNAGRTETVSALHYLKADVFKAQENPAAAEEELNRAIAADENYLPAYTALASLLVGRNQIDAAVAQYKKLLEKKPSSAVFTLLGMLEESRNNFAAAEENYRRALEIAPDAAIAANNLAWLLSENNQGNLDEALRLAQSAVTSDQNAALFYDTLGYVYFKKGLNSQAIEHFKKAVALDQAEARKTGVGANPSFRLRLGMALALAGDKASARREVVVALENEGNLTQKEAQQAKTLLSSL
jgi:tetratricopeptide (TPR) repeat protein